MTHSAKNQLNSRWVVGLGELLWDCLPDGRKAGGAPANFACHAAALGGNGAIVSAVGDDADGTALIQAFSRPGLNTDGVAHLAGLPTGMVLVHLDAKGQPSYEIREGVAWDALPWSPTLATIAARTEAVCFGTLAQRDPRSRMTIYRFLDSLPADCLRIFDMNLRQNYFNREVILESLSRCDVLKVNHEELIVVRELLNLTGSDEAALIEVRRTFRLRAAVVTNGSAGSLLVHEGGAHAQAALAVDCVDSIGAGDSFAATLAQGLLQQMPPAVAHAAAARVAAAVCGSVGATPPLPESLLASLWPISVSC